MIPINIPDTRDPVELFLALVQIASPSQKEKNIVQLISTWLRERDIVFSTDGANKITQGNSGNLVIRKPAEPNPEKPTVLLVAHLDTVQKAEDAITPVIKNGVICSSGNTILGADNKSAVAAVLSIVNEQDIFENVNIIAALTTSEEKGRMGAEALGEIAQEVDYAFSIDGSYPVGTIIDEALGHTSFRIEVIGKAAHAAKDPEKGIHSLQAASKIVSRLKMGWNDNWVLNISSIEGGEVTNLVPSRNVIEGELRSFSQEGQASALAKIERVIEDVSKESGAKVSLEINDQVPPFKSTVGPEIKEAAIRAAQDLGLEPKVIKCMATLEANVLQNMGMKTLGVASGGENPHSTEECIKATEIESLARFLRHLLVQL